MAQQKQSNQAIQVNSEQAMRVAVKMMENQRNLMLVGAPGVAKTAVIEQSAVMANMELILFHPVISDPTDFKGMPAILKNEDGAEMKFLAQFVPFDNLKRLLTADVPTVAFADDLGQAPPMVQAAWMQLVLARKLDDKVVSKNITFMSASNRKEDKAGVSGILEPLKSRFHTILELIVVPEIWLKWARTPEAHIHPYVRAFIRWRPKLLYDFVASNDMTNSPNPRTVEHVSDIIWDGHDDDTRPAVIAGAAGVGFASEFETFVKVVKELPKMAAIIKHPKKCPVPSNHNVSAQYAIIEAMLDQANKKYIEPFLIYISRFKPEFQQWFTTQLKEHKPECVNTKAFTDWASKFGVK